MRTPSDVGRRQPAPWAGLALVVLVSAAYLPALSTGFNADDFLILWRIKSIAGLAQPFAYFKFAFYEYFRPLAFLSYALDWRLWGLNPFGFHLTNVVVHVVNVALVFRLAFVLFAASEGRAPAAFAVAALFAVHPMLSEAVDYVSARSELLCAAFFFVAWLGFAHALVRGGALAATVGVAGYVLAVAAHAAWNGAAFFGGGQFFLLTYLFMMVPAFLMLVGFATWARAREGVMLTRALDDAAARGFLNRAEVPWLVRLPARRASRAYARRHGGPLAERVMREYQQQAVELGFLHDRYLRGTAPADFAPRGTVMVRRLDALRPYVLFPQPAHAQTQTPTPWKGNR